MMSLAAVRHAITHARIAGSALVTSGMVRALRPKAVLSFVRAARHAPRSPSLIVALHARNTPDRLALVDGDARFTFRQLDERINRLAHGLRALGVKAGSRVAVMMHNRHEILESQWAITRLGAVSVQIGYRLKPPEVAHILQNSEPSALIYEAELADTAEQARKTAQAPASSAMVRIGAGGSGRDYEQILATGEPSLPRGDREHAGGIMVYTSGTTGRPKGAARALGKTLHAPIGDFIRQVRFRHDDRHLVVCPLYHSAAPMAVALTYVVGGACVILRRFDPEEILRTIERERITSCLMVPTMLGRLATLSSEILRRYDTSSLRWLLSAAAPLPTDTARRVEEVFGPILYNFYAATETGLVTLARPGEHTARPGTIGRPLFGTEIKLLDEHGHEVPVGAAGELWVKSSMLVEGYHRDSEATQRAMRDGFFSVGDVARRDAEGFYYVCDRKVDMVISGGVNVYPLEVEERLYAHPAVLECAVVGVPDADWGEVLKAFVVMRPGMEATADVLRGWCKEALADFKCPKMFQFVDTLPRNPTGKVQKRVLQAQVDLSSG